MSRFKLFTGMGLTKERIASVVSEAYSLADALEVLRISNSESHRRRLSYWCQMNEVPISHLKHSGGRGQAYTIAMYQDDFLREMVEKSSCLTQLCLSLGFPPIGSAYRLIGARIRSLYHDGLIPYKRDMECRSVRRRLTDELFFTKGSLRNGNMIKRRLIACGYMDVCSICRQPPVWRGETLVLQVDHIDGDPTNNLKENLRIVCPHCHSQLETSTSGGRSKRKGLKGRTILKKEVSLRTYQGSPFCCSLCGRPKKTKSKTNLCPDCVSISRRKAVRPSRERLLELLTGEISFLALGRQLGVSDQAVRKWCRQLGLDTKKMGRAAKTAKRRQTIPTARHSTKESNMQEVPYVVCPLPDPQVVTLEVGAEMPN